MICGQSKKMKIEYLTSLHLTMEQQKIFSSVFQVSKSIDVNFYHN
jgi:hypothetical protein